MSSEDFDPYAVLGVPRNASLEEITAAWRRKAMAAHPDRGGSTEAMVDINMAYEVLKDPAMRAKYDAGGGTQRVVAIEKRAEEYLLAQVRHLIRSSEAHNDLVELLRATVRSQQGQCQQLKAKTQAEIAMLRERIKRLKGPPDNFIETVLLAEIANGEALLQTFDSDYAVMAAALVVLEGYSYDNVWDRWVGDLPKPDAIAMDEPGKFSLFGSWSR